MIGHRVVRLESVDSTNSVALGLATGPDAHGTVVVADVQTAGRGQYGRTWWAEPGESLLASVIVDPPPSIRRPAMLIAWAAVALADAIEELMATSVRLKWPNDLLLRDQKVCGILTESGNSSVVVGFGLNLNQSREQFDRRQLPNATSLSLVRGRPFDRDDALATVLRHFDRLWQSIAVGHLANLEAGWMRRLNLLGRAVAAERVDGVMILGRMTALGFDGIELATDAGVVVAIPPESVRSLRAL